MTRKSSGNQAPAGQHGSGGPVRSGVWFGVVALALALAAAVWYRHRQTSTATEMPAGPFGSTLVSENPPPSAEPPLPPQSAVESPAPGSQGVAQPPAPR